MENEQYLLPKEIISRMTNIANPLSEVSERLKTIGLQQEKLGLKIKEQLEFNMIV